MSANTLYIVKFPSPEVEKESLDYAYIMDCFYEIELLFEQQRYNEIQRAIDNLLDNVCLCFPIEMFIQGIYKLDDCKRIARENKRLNIRVKIEFYN